MYPVLSFVFKIRIGKDKTRDKTIFRIPFYLWLYRIAPKKYARMRAVLRTSIEGEKKRGR